MTRNVLSLEEAKRKFRDALAARFEGKRTTAVATVTSVERDTVSGHTTGKVRATIDGVADQSVFIGAGTGVAVGESLRVENRAGGIGPEWVSLGKTGSVAGSEGDVDTGRPLSTPSNLVLSSSTYASGTSVAARITVQFDQIGDWEAAANYEIAYYRDADGEANQHVSNAPHVNGQSAVQYAILSLLPGTSYSVKVRAVGYGGSLSSWTAIESITTATDASIPTVPTGFGASQVSDTALRFYWARIPDADFAYYEIGVSSTSGAGGLIGGYPVTTGDTPEHIHNVTPATNRWFRVRAIDTSGNASAWSSFSGPHATVETVTGSIVIGDLINQSYGLGLAGSPSKIIIDLATASGLAFEGGTGNLLITPDRLLSIADNAVGITTGATYQFIGTGSGTAAGWRNISELAGNGLTAATGVLAVSVKEGVEIDADAVRVDEDYAFTWAAGHTFQADIQLDADLDFVGAQSITTTTGNLTISPAGDVMLNPTGADVRMQSGVTVRSENYASQTTGWGIDYTGGADFRYLFADEMHVKSFIADLEQALAGGQIISKSVAMLAVAFTAPAASGTATLTIRDLPSAQGMAAFQTGDIVRLRSFSRAAGALTIGDCWGVVTSYVGNGNGTQSWTFTRSAGGNAGAMTAGTVIAVDSIVLDYGTTGTGFYEVNAIDGTYGVNSPYAQIVTWATHPATGSSVRTRIGNLKGITSATEYGMWAGQNNTDKYLLLSDTNFEVHGLQVSLYSSGTETIRLDPAIPSIGLGATLPTAFGQDGIWMGRHSDGTYRLSLAESANDHYLKWTHDGSRYYLDIAGNLYLHDSPGAGGDDLGATLTIDSHGQIVMGSNGKIAMGASSTFTAAAGSSFTIGELGTGAYLSYVGGELTIEGMLTVTDGADFLPIEYRPVVISASFETNFVSGTTWNLWGALPYGDDGGYVAGRMETANGNVYTLLTADTVDSTGSRYIKIAVRKTRLAGDSSVGSIAYPNTIYIPGTSCVICNNFTDAEWTALSEAERNNRVVIADAYLTADFSDVVSVSFRSESGLSIITPDFIRTPNLSSLSADLGSVTAGSIVVGSTNKLWLNDDATAATVALAIGGSTKASAPFLVYEDGDFHAGGSAANYLDWNGTTLTVKGTIQADAGYLGALTVTGNLTMSGGKIQWNSNNSYIDNTKIYVSESETKSILRIGDTSQSGGGILDIDLFQSADSAWTHGIHINDGGNKLSSASSLYHGESNNILTTFVDRIFDARTYGNSRSDGFYGEMSAYNDGVTWDAVGAVFKGRHLSGGPVALFSQHGTSGGAAAVWVDSSKTGSTLLKMQTGAATQTGIHLDNPNGYTDFVAMKAGNGGVEYVRYQRFINLTTSTPGAGDAGVPTAVDTGEFIIYARGNALRMKNSQYEWTFSAGSATAL